MNTDAEQLLDIADSLGPRDRLVVFEDAPSNVVEVVRLAMCLKAQPADLKLRALVEQWSRFRIVQELY